MAFFARLIIPRLLLSLITLLVVSLIIFWSVEWLPGDPATRMLGQNASPERIAVLREQMHLDLPPLMRYAWWLSDFIRGDWGTSLVSKQSVATTIAPRLRNTLILSGLTLAVYIPVSVVLGIITAVLRGTMVSTWLSVLIIAGTSVPDFVVGIFLLYAFATTLPIFPPVVMMDRVETLPEMLHALALPVLTMTAAMTAYAVRMMQESLVAVLESDYVRMATLKGLPNHRILLKHALPNALGPALRVTALNIAYLIGGIVLVEHVFTFPGIGRLLIESIRTLDTPVIEAIALILASVYVIANLGADVVSTVLNPRLREG